MISISKVDNVIKFSFTNSKHYLYGSGTVEVPVNSLLLVEDKSDMITLKKIDGDPFISFLISDSNFSSKSDFEDFYKSNMVGGDGGGKAVSGGTNISITTGETADTINCTLPISGINSNNSITGLRNPYETKNNSTGYYNLLLGYGNKLQNYKNYNYIFGIGNEGGGASGGSNKCQFIAGSGNICKNNYESAFGHFNKNVTDLTIGTLFSVGNGTADNARHNAFEIRQNGDIYISSGGTDILLQDHLGGGGGGGVTSGEVQTMIDTSISGKQDTLSAGTGISISGNVISATGGGGGGKAISAGTNISVTTGETADTINCTIPAYRSGSSNGISLNYDSNTASGSRSIAGGTNCKAIDENSVALGYNSEARNPNTFAMGQYAIASGFCSAAICREAQAKNMAEFACGQHNVSNKANTTFGDSGNTLFSVGNGTGDNAKHNAFEIRQNGDIYISSGGTDILLQDHLGGGGGGGNNTVELTQAQYDALVSGGTVDPSTYYIITDAQSVDISQYWTSAQTDSAITSAVSGKVDTSAITTAVTSGSTDSEIPTAKAVYNVIGNINTILESI